MTDIVVTLHLPCCALQVGTAHFLHTKLLGVALLQISKRKTAQTCMLILVRMFKCQLSIISGIVHFILDFILDERARELAGEVSRWLDLKRTGKLIERVLAHNPHAALNNAIEPRHLVRPIPQAEVDLSNGSIRQNDDY